METIRRAKHGPEWHIQQALIAFLQHRGWQVEPMHGNLFQQGIPDLFIAHPRWGQRWIDCKHPIRYTFTRAQRRKWPLWDKARVGIWILTAANQTEYDKLFAPPNWRQFWKPKWGPLEQSVDIDALLAQLD